jgi:hypothetical protein
VFGVTQTDNFQYQNQIVDIDNLTQRDQRKNVLITDKNLFFTQMFWQQGLHQCSTLSTLLHDAAFKTEYKSCI